MKAKIARAMHGARRLGRGRLGRGRLAQGPFGDDRGATTAEYAVTTMAAVGFAGLLVVLLRGDQVRGILADLITRALSAGG